MDSPLLNLGAAMFGVPFVILFLILFLIALTGNQIPPMVLQVGGWSMAFGVIIMGLGAFLPLRER